MIPQNLEILETDEVLLREVIVKKQKAGLIVITITMALVMMMIKKKLAILFIIHGHSTSIIVNGYGNRL